MILSRGSTGQEVAALQEKLASAGFPVKVDGVFGPDTAQALAAFQKSANLHADSVYGDKTRGVLEPPLPRDNPSRAVMSVAAALAGGGGQGAGAQMQLEPPQAAQVAAGPAPGIGSDPDRNVSMADLLPAMNEARFQNADRASLAQGGDAILGTGARVAPPPGMQRMGANSPFDDPATTEVDPNFRAAPEQAYDPLASMRPPAPRPVSFDERWSVRPEVRQQQGLGERLFSNQAFAAQTSMTKEQQQALALAAARRRRAEGATPQPDVTQPYSGSLLPFSKDAKGNVRFDPNAGIIGSIRRAVTLPGEVYAGKVDPNSDEAIARSAELATLASPVNPAVRSGEQVLPGAIGALRRENVPPPSAEALKAAGGAGYDAARDMGVHYSSDAVRKMVDEIRFNLNNDGILAELAPKTFSVLEKLGSPPAGSTAPLAGIEAARRAFGNAAKDFTNPTEQMAAGRVIDGLDRFTEMADPATVVAGPAAAAGRTVRDARGNYAAAKRSEQLHGIEDSADLNAKVANSGQNTENAIRQRTKSLLQSPKQIAGYSAAEVAAIRRVAEGTATANTLRFVGNLLGGGGGLGAVVTGGLGGMAGSAFGGPLGMVAGAAMPSAGFAAKKVAAALARARLRGADEMVRRRSPLYGQMSKDAPIADSSQGGVSAVIKALLMAHPEWFGQQSQPSR